MDNETTGSILTVYLTERVQIEHERQSSLEAKGVNGVATSSGLLTLVGGASAIFGFPNGGSWKPMIVLGMALIALAGFIGVFAIIPSKYKEVTTESLEIVTRKNEWSNEGREASRQLAIARLASLSSLETMNNRKAILIVAALSSQLLGAMISGSALLLLSI